MTDAECSVTDDLKPCPFCGGSDIEYDNADERSGGQWLCCNICEFRFATAYGQDLRAMWNRRPVLPKSEAGATFDVLVLQPQTKPVYFVVKGRRDPADSDAETMERKAYFYEEHSCPTNWLKDIELLSFDGDHDPHGLLEFIGTCPAEGMEPEDVLEAAIAEADPDQPETK